MGNRHPLRYTLTAKGVRTTMSQSTKGMKAGDGESLSKSEFQWLFSEPRCRTTLEVLDELVLPVDIETLAGAVATIESNQDTDGQIGADEVAASLHHTHLPKMDRLGVIRYQPESNRVSDPAELNPTLP